MKKIITATLAAAVTAGTFSTVPLTSAADSSAYEFEDGIITSEGENKTSVIELSGADGGKAVDLKDSGDSVTVEARSENDGMQTISIRYSQPYDEGGKYQNIIVNGSSTGELFFGYTGDGKFRTATASVPLKKGSNTITVEAS